MTATLDLFTVQPAQDAPEGVPPKVAALFERLAKHVWDSGIRHYSADAILHRIRWHYNIERGDRDFKCNNNWTAPLARWFMAKHPECPKFFELREKRQ